MDGQASVGHDSRRVFGPSRFETATEISETVLPNGAVSVDLSRADIAPDAVVAGFVTDGPILLVESCSGIQSATTTEIQRQPDRTFPLAGPRSSSTTPSTRRPHCSATDLWYRPVSQDLRGGPAAMP